MVKPQRLIRSAGAGNAKFAYATIFYQNWSNTLCWSPLYTSFYGEFLYLSRAAAFGLLFTAGLLMRNELLPSFLYADEIVFADKSIEPLLADPHSFGWRTIGLEYTPQHKWMLLQKTAAKMAGNPPHRLSGL